MAATLVLSPNLTYQLGHPISMAITSPPAPVPILPPSSMKRPLAPFTYRDPVHGPWRIESPCILSLLAHPAVVRLRHVLQHGITALIGLTPDPPETRWEHSLGAMIAVAKAGGTEEAMIAALLHDVAHTALSHVADTVYGYVVHEQDKDQFLVPSGILELLTAHGFDPARILHEENFSLLELDSPAVCADRFDYGLRDSVNFGTLALVDAQAISDAMTAYVHRTPGGRLEKRMGFPQRHLDRALALARAYIASDALAWANGKHTWLYYLAADAIKHAEKEGTITKADLWWPKPASHLPEHSGPGDAGFWRMLWERGTPETRRRWADVHCDYDVEELAVTTPALLMGTEGQEIPLEVVGRKALAPGVDVFTAKIKSRVLDPDIIISDDGEGAVERLSVLVPEWKREMDAHRDRCGGTRRFRITNRRIIVQQ